MQRSAFPAALAFFAAVMLLPAVPNAQGIDFDRLWDQTEEAWDNTGRALEETGENIGRTWDETVQGVDEALAQPAAPSVGSLATDILGAQVISPEGETLATIDDLVIVPPGSVVLAVLRVGGGLGVGGDLVAVDYTQLTPNGDTGNPWFELPREQLLSAPAYRISGAR